MQLFWFLLFLWCSFAWSVNLFGFSCVFLVTLSLALFRSLFYSVLVYSVSVFTLSCPFASTLSSFISAFPRVIILTSCSVLLPSSCLTVLFGCSPCRLCIVDFLSNLNKSCVLSLFLSCYLHTVTWKVDLSKFVLLEIRIKGNNLLTVKTLQLCQWERNV